MRNEVLVCLLGVLVQHLVSALECEGTSDILFMVDDSDSTKRNNPSDPDTVIFAPGVKSFIQLFIDNTNLETVRLSIVTFSETCRVISNFTSDASTLTVALSSFKPDYQGSDLSKCMEKAGTIFDTQGRLGVRQFIIVLTDGSSKFAQVAADHATNLENFGIDVVAIAFGNAITMSELLSYAKDPAQVFKVLSDTQLSTLLYSNITNLVCEEDPCTVRVLSGDDVGLYSYPGNCAKFVHLDPTGCVVKDCAYTTMWNDQFKTCDFPYRSTCDPCRGQPDGRQSIYRMYCNAFWECQGGVSQARCCGTGTKYVLGSGCVPAGAGECSNPCP